MLTIGSGTLVVSDFSSSILDYFHILNVLSGSLLLLFVSQYIPYTQATRFIAYGSMCGYLFHRIIFIILHNALIGAGLDYSYLFSLLVFMPVCLVLTYYIQLGYDKFVLPFFK